MCPSSATDHAIGCILMDFDGTVADCFEDIQSATNFAMRNLGLPEHDLPTIRTFVGNGVGHLAAAACGDAAAQHAPRALELIVEYYREHPADHARLYPGIRDLLESIRAGGLRVGIVSNKVHALTLVVVERLGIAPLVGAIVGQRPELPKKPDPTMLLEACAHLAADPAASIMIGDGPMDMQAARTGGLAAWGVTWGMSDAATLRMAGANEIFDNTAQILDTISLEWRESSPSTVSSEASSHGTA